MNVMTSIEEHTDPPTLTHTAYINLYLIDRAYGGPNAGAVHIKYLEDGDWRLL